MEPASASATDNINEEPLKIEICLDKVEQIFPLIDRHVKVEMIKNYSYNGYLHAIDPVTKSTILTVPDDDDGTCKTILIPGHAIRNIIETPSTSNIKPTRKQKTIISEENLKTRKENIVNWLKKHLLPAEERSGVIDIGNVSILTPYTTNDICASNPVVAEQMRKILASLPT